MKEYEMKEYEHEKKNDLHFVVVFWDLLYESPFKMLIKNNVSCKAQKN